MPSNMNEFIQLMKNRLVIRAFRYGLFADKTGYDNFGYLKIKLAKYYETGNLELLVDIANIALLCYTTPPSQCIQATTFEWLRRRLFAATVPELRPAPDTLYQTEWNFEFEQKLRASKPPAPTLWWYMLVLTRYASPRTFVNIAYTAWREFEHPGHPNAHWRAKK